MAADGQFGALLQALQSPHAQYGSPRYLGAALASLLALNNPLNVTLLVSQLLSSPALWNARADDNRCFAFLSLFHTAATGVEDRGNAIREPAILMGDWVEAVLQAIDDRSHPAQHVLVLGGLLTALGGHGQHVLSWRQLDKIRTGFVDAINAAVRDPTLDHYAQTGLVLALTHSMPFLQSGKYDAKLDYDSLLPVLMHALLHSSEGLDSFRVLRAIDQDVLQSGPTQFSWGPDSPSCIRLEQISARPLVQAFGPLAKLISHCLDHARDSSLLLSAIEDTRDFVVSMHSRWYATKLSEVDVSEENVFLSFQTVQQSLPRLHAIFKSVLFAVVIILRSAVGRALCDTTLANEFLAPRIAQDALTSLRHLRFTLSRLGATFTQHDFLLLAALDILNANPDATADYLASIAPSHHGSMPSHPLERCLDHFFFEIAEHCPSHCAPYLATTEPYLTLSSSSPSLLPIVEAAHSLVLSTFSAPGNEASSLERIPAYIERLRHALRSKSISERQFCIAFKTLVRVANGDGIRAFDPNMSDVLMEILYHGAISPEAVAQNGGPVYLDALIDCLPRANPDSLEEWLNLSSQAINTLPRGSARAARANRLWDMIYGGEMDHLRTQICVIWWVHKGGKGLIFGSEESNRPGIIGAPLETRRFFSGRAPPHADNAARL